MGNAFIAITCIFGHCQIKKINVHIVNISNGNNIY